MYATVSRVASLLTTQFTGADFWTVGLDLFQAAASVITQLDELMHMHSCINLSHKFLGDERQRKAAAAAVTHTTAPPTGPSATLSSNYVDERHLQAQDSLLSLVRERGLQQVQEVNTLPAPVPVRVPIPAAPAPAPAPEPEPEQEPVDGRSLCCWCKTLSGFSYCISNVCEGSFIHVPQCQPRRPHCPRYDCWTSMQGYVFQRTATRPHAKCNLLTISCSSFAEQSVVVAAAAAAVVIVVHVAFLLPRHLEMNYLCTLTRMTIFFHLALCEISGACFVL
jgi:hypothetical protein